LPRGLAPCVYADNRLYVAPLDDNRLFCLDAGNGRLVWEREGIEVVHLLGVSRGGVFVATKRGLQCLNADTGEQGWLQPAEGRLPSLGRGLVAGSWLLWPTQDPKFPYRGVTLRDGNQERFSIDKKEPEEPEYLEPTMLRNILQGNMIFGENCLVVAGLEELAVYVPQKHFLKERQEKTLDAKFSPLPLYQLAMSQADAGFRAEAKSNFLLVKDVSWQGLIKQRIVEISGQTQSSQDIPRLKPNFYSANGIAKTGLLQALDLPLLKIGETSSQPISWLPFPSSQEDGLVLGRNDKFLFCLDAVANKLKWQRSLGDFEEPTLMLGSIANQALLADSTSLIGLDLATGAGPPLWTVPMPLKPRAEYDLSGNQPNRLTNPFPPAHCRRNSRLLFFMVDERMLVALDPRAGKFVWSFWAPGGQMRPLADGGRFSPHYHAGDDYVLVQSTDGKRFVLDSDTGKVLHEGPAPGDWVSDPLAIGQNRFVLSEEAGQVYLLNANTGLVNWTCQPRGYTSLTGAPSQVFGDRNKLFALVPRNIGPELVRLHPDKGTLLWNIPFLPGDIDAATASYDDEAIFFVCQNILQARSIRDGTLLWKNKLPGTFTSWQTFRVAKTLLVYPHEETRVPWVPVASPFAPWHVRVFTKPEQERAINLVNPRDGQFQQRLPVANEPGPIAVRVAADRLVVNAGGKLRVYRSAQN